MERDRRAMVVENPRGTVGEGHGHFVTQSERLTVERNVFYVKRVERGFQSVFGVAGDLFIHNDAAAKFPSASVKSRTVHDAGRVEFFSVSVGVLDRRADRGNQSDGGNERDPVHFGPARSQARQTPRSPQDCR